MKNNKWIIIAGVVLVLLIVVALIGKKQGWIGQGVVKEVAVESVKPLTIIELVTASGKIYPKNEVKVSSEVSGEIVQLNVAEGDSVKKGDLLLVINPSIYESVVTQSEAGVNQLKAGKLGAEAGLLNSKAALDQALKNFERNQELHREKVISDAEFESVKLSLEQAKSAYSSARENVNAASANINSGQAQVQQARENLAKTKIFAPATGIVSLLNVKLGERVVGTAQMAGTELIRIADLDVMQAEVDVNENDVLRISLGDTAEIEVDAYTNRKFKGIVTQVAYSSQTATSIVSTSQATNFTVKIELTKDSYADIISPEKGKRFPFRPGMSATADIKTEMKQNILAVPIQSVTAREEEALKEETESDEKKEGKESSTPVVSEESKKELKEIVFVVEGDVVKAVQVKTGIQDASNIEIVSGLKQGQQVVKAPYKLISKTLKNGDLVKVVKEEDLFTEGNKEEE